ncbi:hypothetical protein EMIT079MI2_100104 [Bacillus sp. IT-79MI2]
MKYLRIHKTENAILSNILLNDILNIHEMVDFSQVSGFIFLYF